MTKIELDAIPELPVDKDGPVFTAPWQAQAFAMVVSLQGKGVFTWQEWAAELGGSIENARRQGDPDLGNTYYEHWLAALENITTQKGLANAEILARRKQEAHETQQKLHTHKH